MFLFPLDRKAPTLLCNVCLLDFLNVITTAIVCLAPVYHCKTSPTRGVGGNAGRTSDGALDRRLLVKQEKKHPVL